MQSPWLPGILRKYALLLSRGRRAALKDKHDGGVTPGSLDFLHGLPKERVYISNMA